MEGLVDGSGSFADALAATVAAEQAAAHAEVSELVNQFHSSLFLHTLVVVVVVVVVRKVEVTDLNLSVNMATWMHQRPSLFPGDDFGCAGGDGCAGGSGSAGVLHGAGRLAGDPTRGQGSRIRVHQGW